MKFEFGPDLVYISFSNFSSGHHFGMIIANLVEGIMVNICDNKWFRRRLKVSMLKCAKNQ